MRVLTAQGVGWGGGVGGCPQLLHYRGLSVCDAESVLIRGGVK